MTAVGNPASAADAEEPPRSAGLLEPPPGADGNICSPDPGDVDALASEPALRPPTEDELAQLADLAFATATAWLSVPDRFYTLARGAGIDPDSAPAQPLRSVLGFFLTEETKSGRRSVELRWKTGFHTDALPPPRLRSVAASEAEVWRILADKVTHPAARARLLDVLVLRGGKDTPERAAAAIEAYLDHATTPTTVIKRTDGEDVETSWLYRGLTLSLGRALSLAHIAAVAATGKASAERAVTVALSHAGARIRSNRPQAGSVMSTLSLLAANRTLLSPAETAMLLSLIEEAASRYANLDNAIDQLMSLLVLLDPARREDAHRLRVQTRLNRAVGKEPMVAMRFLEDAARLARIFHLDDLRDEAVRKMQRVARLDHGLQTVSANVTIPGPILDAEVRRASDGADWRESMSSWLATPAPSGDLATNERTSRNVASRSLVRHLASTVLLGADNMPRWRPETEADKDAYELSRTESLRMTLSGQLLSEALDRIVGLHGVPPVAELAMFAVSCNGGVRAAWSRAAAHPVDQDTQLQARGRGRRDREVLDLAPQLPLVTALEPLEFERERGFARALLEPHGVRAHVPEAVVAGPPDRALRHGGVALRLPHGGHDREEVRVHREPDVWDPRRQQHREVLDHQSNRLLDPSGPAR